MEEKKAIEYNWDSLNKKTYNNRVGHYKFRRQFQFIIKNGKNHCDKVLDIAGGSGRIAIPLLEYSSKITVLDIKPNAIKILKKRNSDINTICDNFMKAEFQEIFSLILCIEAIGAFNDWEEFFSKINTLLTDDGRFIFTYTNPKSWRFSLRKIMHWNDPNKGVQLKELTKILNKFNFEIENMEGFNWMPLPLYSNSRLVYFFEFIEKIFNLKSWYSQSPWLLISIKKRT